MPTKELAISRRPERMQVTKETRNACQFANAKSASVYERFPFILPCNGHPGLLAQPYMYW
jgi:hypothetical protein